MRNITTVSVLIETISRVFYNILGGLRFISNREVELAVPNLLRLQQYNFKQVGIF
jgi:hypothetical protein